MVRWVAVMGVLVGCGNAPPTVGSVQLTPVAPTTDEAVTAQVVSLQDADGDAIEVRWSWTVSGDPIEAGDTLPASAFARGDVIIATATPFDGLVEGEPVSSQAITVVNAAPRVADVEITPRDPTSADTLGVDVIAEDPDGDPVELTWTWLVDGEVAGNDSSLPPPNPRGSEIVVEVRGSDGELVSDGVLSDTVITANAPPPVPATPTLTGGEWVPSELVCTVPEVLDPDGDPVDLVVQFQVDGVPGDTVTAQDGVATVSKLGTSRGGVWTCRARASDDAGASSDWSPVSEAIDQSCDRDTVTIMARRNVSLAYNTGTFWEDNILRVYEYGSEGGNSDIVAWLAFDLGGVGRIRGIQDAELVVGTSSVFRSPEVAIVQTSLDDWLVGEPLRSRLVRTGEITDARTGFTAGDTVRFGLDLDRWTDGPQPGDLAFTIGIDNFTTAQSYVYFRALGDSTQEPSLELTICR